LRVEGGDGAHAFDLVHVPPRGRQRLAEKRLAGCIAEKEQPFGAGKGDVTARDIAAGFEFRPPREAGKRVESGQSGKIGVRRV
jgi:hypothetical protein